jgi:hypothetical protein
LPDHNVALAALFEEFQEVFPGSPAEEYLKSRGIVFDNLTCPFPGYAAPGEWPGRPWEGGRIVFPHHIPDMDKGFPGTCNLYGRALPVNGQDAPKELRHDHLPGPKGIYNAWALKKPQVIITEGVFDALSFMMSGYQAIAVFGTSGFRSIWTAMPYTPIVIIGADNDEAGQKAAVEAWRGLALGKAVYVERPPKDCKDWNEVFMKHGMIHLPIYRPPKRYTLLRPYPDHYETWEVAREEDVLEPGEDGRWRDKQGRVMSFDDLFGRPKRMRGKDSESLGLDNEPLGRLIARDGIVETWECGY